MSVLIQPPQCVSLTDHLPPRQRDHPLLILHGHRKSVEGCHVLHNSDCSRQSRRLDRNARRSTSPCHDRILCRARRRPRYDFPSISSSYASRSRNHVSLCPQVSDLALATEHVLDELTRSTTNIAWALAHELFRKPTIRLVRSGTFSDFRQLKLDEGSNNLGQVKVPVVLPKAAYVTWFSDRVVQEL